MLDIPNLGVKLENVFTFFTSVAASQSSHTTLNGLLYMLIYFYTKRYV